MQVQATVIHGFFFGAKKILEQFQLFFGLMFDRLKLLHFLVMKRRRNNLKSRYSSIDNIILSDELASLCSWGTLYLCVCVYLFKYCLDNSILPNQLNRLSSSGQQFRHVKWIHDSRSIVIFFHPLAPNEACDYEITLCMELARDETYISQINSFPTEICCLFFSPQSEPP